MVRQFKARMVGGCAFAAGDGSILSGTTVEMGALGGVEGGFFLMKNPLSG
jgi:hypothetical protein